MTSGHEIIAANENLEKITRDFMRAIETFSEETTNNLSTIRSIIDNNGIYGGESNEDAKESVRANLENIGTQIERLSALNEKLNEKAVLYGQLIEKFKEIVEK